MQPMSSPSDLAVNMPNASLMYSTFTPTFGNLMFAIQPSPTGEVSDTFGTVPYMSLEGLIYMQQVQAATSSTNTVSGNTTGQQNITGALTITDQSGNVIAQLGAGSLSSNGAASTAQPINS
jgi:hypothetical protein